MHHTDGSFIGVPMFPVVHELADEVANAFTYKINTSQFQGARGDVQMKQSKFNRIFPEEYTGNIYVGRHENGWVAYNALAGTQTASIPFKYNTCEKMELAYAKYSASVIKEYADKVTFYLTNYSNESVKKTDVIKIFGMQCMTVSEIIPQWDTPTLGQKVMQPCAMRYQ